MLLDAVLGLNHLAIRCRVAALRAPGQEVAADLDVVVRELAVLVVVHSEELSVLRGAQLQAGDEVDNFGNNGRHDKSVGGRGDNDGDLPAQDGVVAVEEATDGARVDAVEANDVLAGEEGVEDEADHAADAVLSKDIERVVDADEELDLGAKVAADACGNAEDDAGPGIEEARGGSGGNEAGNGAGAPANHGPLLSKAEIEEAPGHGGKHGSQARVPAGHDSAEVGAKGRATVEAEPAKPKEDGAEGDE